jgi:lysophospholipase L1-like esterase
MQLKAGENPHYPEGQKDNTHFNDYGARRIAELVLAEIKAQHLELAEHIVKR